MRSSAFETSLLAMTCNLQGTDIYLGLAACCDDQVIARAFQSFHVAAFPIRRIRVASHDDREIPLRVYTVRDPSIVSITRIPGPASIDGFQRVRLILRSEDAPQHDHDRVAAPRHPHSEEDSPENGVMAFVLTVGLPEHLEDDFYHRVLSEFLDKSWMALPRLLRDIGCGSGEEIARGQPAPCR